MKKIIFLVLVLFTFSFINTSCALSEKDPEPIEYTHTFKFEVTYLDGTSEILTYTLNTEYEGSFLSLRSWRGTSCVGVWHFLIFTNITCGVRKFEQVTHKIEIGPDQIPKAYSD